MAFGLDRDSAFGREFCAAVRVARTEMNFVCGSLVGYPVASERVDHHVGHAVAVQVAEGVQHPAGHVPAGERGKIVGVETYGGREGHRHGIEQTLAVLDMRFEAIAVPGHQVDAPVAVVIECVDPAHAPGIVPVPVGPVDTVQVGGGTNFHRIGKGAAGQLDEHLERVAGRYDQVDPAIAVHVPGDVHVRHLILTGRREVGRDGREFVFRCRTGIPRVQPALPVRDQPVVVSDSGNVDEGYAGT